mmetsp:Transcript_85100/g.245747  ORF Transcript_85100/g.245747 Transcript_85100/m.245747 type:complete len:217 (-) Transcript_85100:253-903(-)
MQHPFAARRHHLKHYPLPIRVSHRLQLCEPLLLVQRVDLTGGEHGEAPETQHMDVMKARLLEGEAAKAPAGDKTFELEAFVGQVVGTETGIEDHDDVPPPLHCEALPLEDPGRQGVQGGSVNVEFHLRQVEGAGRYEKRGHWRRFVRQSIGESHRLRAEEVDGQARTHVVHSNNLREEGLGKLPLLRGPAHRTESTTQLLHCHIPLAQARLRRLGY